jgi:hypothetical protein
VLFRPGGVNLRDSLCGVQSYASAQSLDFLARTKNPSFPDRKLSVSHPEFLAGNQDNRKAPQAANLAGLLFVRPREALFIRPVGSAQVIESYSEDIGKHL